MIGSARKKLLGLQKGIFRSLRVDASRLLGEPPAEIKKYEREFQSDFRPLPAAARARDVPKNELVGAIRASDVTLIADFHTFAQAQRAAIRLIRDAIRPGENWAIGLELIPSHCQRALDDYQNGRIPLRQFHRIIEYDEAWGFPWKNYAPIFDWARENGVRLIALNRPKELLYERLEKRAATPPELYQRDDWAAGIIADLFSNHSRSRKAFRMIVLYGELHVATCHLPSRIARVSRAYLKRKLSCLTIHQNHDDIYWKLAASGNELHTHAIRLSARAYCVFSSTPWSKLQSLVTWAEGGLLDEEPEFDTDYLSVLMTYGKTLARFFGVEAPPFESLTLRTIDQADFVEDLWHDERFSPEERRLLRFHVLQNHRIFIPRAGIAYLASPSQNGAAELASIFVLRHQTRSPLLFRHETDDFYRLTLEACFGFLGSLILNPRRKCDLLEDHAERIAALKRHKGAIHDTEREARRIAYRILSEKRDQWSREIPSIMSERKLAAASMLAARYVGQVLGKRLHQAILGSGAKAPGTEEVRAIFLKRWGTRAGEYERRFNQLMRLIAKHRVESTKQETF